MLARGTDRPFHRLARDDLAVARMRIPYRDGPRIRDDLRCLVRFQCAGLEIAHIGDEHADAMAVMAAQVRLHQVLGDDGGFGGRTAAGCHDAVGQRKQFRVIDDHALSPLRRALAPRETHNAGSSASSYSFLKRLINSAAPTMPATLPTPCPEPQISFHALGLARSPEVSVPKLILEGSEVGRLSGSMPAATIEGFR